MVMTNDYGFHFNMFPSNSTSRVIRLIPLRLLAALPYFCHGRINQDGDNCYLS